MVLLVKKLLKGLKAIIHMVYKCIINRSIGCILIDVHSICIAIYIERLLSTANL
jgi:hypothetical protein